MNCAQFRDQVEAWMLGALEPDEAQACEQHLSSTTQHEGCTEALARARETVAALATTLTPQKPDDRVWASIERSLGHEETATPSTQPAAPRRWRERVAWAIAAAALLVAGLLGWRLQRATAAITADAGASTRLKAAYQAALSASRSRETKLQSEKDSCGKELAGLKGDAQLQHDALALLNDPHTQLVALQPPGQGSYRASALVNLTAGRAIVLSNALPLKPGWDFELWVIRGKEPPKPAGFLRPRGDGTVAGEIDRKLLAEGTPDAFAVSVEPAGGRPTPTTVILVGAMKS
jgi:anti-sigma-K factor RskA